MQRPETFGAEHPPAFGYIQTERRNGTQAAEAETLATPGTPEPCNADPETPAGISTKTRAEIAKIQSYETSRNCKKKCKNNSKNLPK